VLSKLNYWENLDIRRRPSQMRSKMTVDVIQEATVKLLSGADLESVTTKDIADLAGVSVGSLYQFFNNKEEIVSSLVFCLMDRTIGVASTLLEARSDLEFHLFAKDVADHTVDLFVENFAAWRASLQILLREGKVSIVLTYAFGSLSALCDAIEAKFGDYININRSDYEGAIRSSSSFLRMELVQFGVPADTNALKSKFQQYILKSFEWDAVRNIAKVHNI